MADKAGLFTQTWGSGEPVLALPPLGLDASAFAGMGVELARRGYQTIGVDLPGFGQTPAPEGPLTPAVLAAPVIELAETLPERAVLLGHSLGGRVALEAALRAPDRFRAVVAVAPYLPWTRLRWALQGAQLMSPWLAERVPLELAWPVLLRVARILEQLPPFVDDAVARAGVRTIYNASCPATRAAIVSAARELALDPAFGPRGLWKRLPDLAPHATFIWGSRDRLVPAAFASRISRTLPDSAQLVLPCLAHAVHGVHQRCLAAAVAAALARRQPFGYLDSAPCQLDAPDEAAAAQVG